MGWIGDFFYGALSFLGLYQKNAKVLFLGLDNAGKTTLLHMLSQEKLTQAVPTFHPNQQELTMGNVKFKTFDLGGHEQARNLWKDYFTKVDAVIYLVDAADRDRLLESKAELDGLLGEEKLREAPFLILGNKIDIPRAAPKEEIRQTLGLVRQCTGVGKVPLDKTVTRPLEIFMCSVQKKTGYKEGFEWLNQYL